jgi:isopentenyl-diphosphate delta-isomerase
VEENVNVILVDELDNELGIMEKLEAHEKALLHRAISVFIFNSKKELLLQRRAFGKYHSEGLWTNTCCSHPLPGETTIEAGKRRLKEEMGMTCELSGTFSFVYKAEFENGLTEYELDHVLIGYSDETPHLNPEEAIAFQWMSLPQLEEEIRLKPHLYTEWFKILILEHMNELISQVEHESL